MGLSGSEPLRYAWPSAEVVAQDNERAILRTYVYEVCETNGSPIGWWPCRPEFARIAYTISGNLSPENVMPGNGDVSGPLKIRVTGGNPIVGAEECQLEVQMPFRSIGTISVYDVDGRLVAVLYDGVIEKGKTAVEWACVDRRGRKVPAGLYFVDCRVRGQSRRTLTVTVTP